MLTGENSTLCFTELRTEHRLNLKNGGYPTCRDGPKPPLRSKM
jgi:hypothetical protein